MGSGRSAMGKKREGAEGVGSESAVIGFEGR